jgi:hypothetical protein
MKSLLIIAFVSLLYAGINDSTNSIDSSISVCRLIDSTFSIIPPLLTIQDANYYIKNLNSVRIVSTQKPIITYQKGNKNWVITFEKKRKIK